MFSEQHKLIFLNTQIELRTEKGQAAVIIIIILLRISGLSVAFASIRKERTHGTFRLLLLAHIRGRFVLVFVLYHTGTFH